MEARRRTVDNRELLERYRELLEEVETLPLLVSGDSMSPFLVNGRDTVWLKKPDRPLRRGDVVLYLRDSGAYVLHRICRAEGDTFSIIGDAHTTAEPGVRRDQIFALVVRVERNGKILAPGSFWWEFFEKIWVRIIPLRRPVGRAYAALSRVFRRK